MRLRAQHRMEVTIRALDLDVRFEPREELRTEISAKFTRARLRGDLAAAGLEVVEVMADPDGLFALALARPGRTVPRHGA
jgi:L-histidine N-alpha-methyltransferase